MHSGKKSHARFSKVHSEKKKLTTKKRDMTLDVKRINVFPTWEKKKEKESRITARRRDIAGGSSRMLGGKEVRSITVASGEKGTSETWLRGRKGQWI